VTQVNNGIYETLGSLWWSEEAGFELTSLRYCVNPVRYGYFRRVLGELGVARGRVLDVGCGGGYLAEAFAADGFEVTGVDPAVNSIAAAWRHAEEHGLRIGYQVGRGEALPCADGEFDVVCCCDVLEHVEDAARVLVEVARTLKPGGVFLYDTVNRTAASWLVLIKIWQDWDLGGFAMPDMHVWEKFLKPGEVAELMRTAGLKPGGVTGITAARGLAAMLWGLWKLRRGALRGPAVAERFAMRESGDTGVSYMGWGRRAGRTWYT
jgi:2-polyprenyl-6-hydroxyphenyl methylase/3-demethylubiquinone-9 3-methyltransferase